MGYFYRRFSDESLNKLYELLEDVTPLRDDCGLLCGAACCRGDGDAGMLLFPGEKEAFEGKEGYAVRNNASYGCDEVICSGACERAERPLSCRIYPYFFYVKGDGKVTVAPDIRALGRCPLAEKGAGASPLFLRRMRMAALVLERDPAQTAFLRQVGEALKDLGPLEELLPLK